MERHIYDSLYNFLTTYKLFLNEQSGVRNNYSSQAVLIKLTDYFLEHIDNGSLCGIIVIDLRKALDLVDHELIIHKLQLYVCNDISLQSFRSYLEGRYQSVSYDGHLSDPLPVTLGVPQGSILGSLLFIMFMNDLILEVENTHLEMYADDSTLCTANESAESINNNLTSQSKPIYYWINVN